MLNRSFVQILIITITTFLLTACGGGGGGGGNAPSPTSSNQTSSSQQLQSLDRINTPVIASAYLDLLSFAKETSAVIVKGEYVVSLADGVYKDTCEGGTGSFEITASNMGNELLQKYKNCSIEIIENGTRQRVIVDGEERVSTVRNENTPSFVTISWKNYSIKTDNLPTQTFDGTFIYEGLLYYNHSAKYIDVTSRIKMTATIVENGQSMSAENVDFTFDFPAIFDRYSNDFDFYTNTPQGLHVFSKKIIKANGNVSVGKNKASFIFNSNNTSVTFSGSTAAKAYLDTASKGFYLKWNQLDDNAIDANTFLTETEYPSLSSNIYEKNSSIYFTRYPNDYGTPHPKNHRSTGQYEPINLSKGATTEINVQELFTSKSGALLTYEINNEQFSKDWEQLEAGKFLLKLPDAGAYDVVELKITAVDSYGNRSPVITAKVHMNDNLADFDNDGIPDYRDPDMDNDGVENYKDSFPKDPTEHSDLDGDRIGDNTDTDTDNDGVGNQDDAYPNDSACSKLESGNNESCYLTNSRYSFTDKNGIAYFTRDVGESSIDGQSYFVRFDTINKVFLSPTPTFNWPAGYSYGFIYDAESHSVVISNNTHDGYEIWQQVSILKLDDFTVTSIDNSRNHNMSMHFHDHGYLVFVVRAWNEPIDFSWIETYDLEGQLIDSTEDEARATPRDDTYYYLQHSRGINFCSFSVSVNSGGNIIKTGHYENRYNDNCGNIISVSENGNYGFALIGYSFSIHEADQPSLSVVEGYNPGWLGNTIVYIENSTGDLIVKKFPSQETRTLGAEQRNGKDVYFSGKNILLMKPIGYGTAASMQLYNEELQLIYDSAQF